MHLTVWQPPDGGVSGRGYRGAELKHCAGYTCNLPEVIEAAITRVHWKVGALVPACGGEQPQEDLMNAILILEGAFNEVEGWLMTPSKDGGGGA